jgi:hypothetical protein
MEILKSSGKLLESVKVQGYRWLSNGQQICEQQVEGHMSDTFLLVKLSDDEAAPLGLENAIGMVDGKAGCQV